MMIKAAVRGPTSCGCNCSVEIIIPAVNYFAGVSDQSKNVIHGNHRHLRSF